ncbi:hypothetical protein [Croceicoccus bisphenolivorans]|uniref:hypothetical protein n=1 Tax=Croceicoccus bisphenolivorans TaxID=1783232 RepID=UPI00082C9244|nr:hypothetical protein [Croceicoccus bisphenolivorans]
MERKIQVFCGWSGIASILLLVIGMGPVAQLSPPPSAMITAAEIAAHVRANAANIQIGMFLVNIGVALSIALVVGISMEIRRIEASPMPGLSYLHMMTGTVASTFLMLPAMTMSVAAFRTDIAPETMLLLHDLSTFFTFLPFSVATLEALVVAAAVFADRSAHPVFPRWLGYYSVITGLSYVPMGLIGLAKEGPFASDGLIGWIIPTALVVPWYLVMGGFLVVRGGRSTGSDA